MKNSHGFSLLEVLVAFTILAMSLPILLKIFSSGVNTAFVAEEYTAAVQIAESHMAAIGVESEFLIGENSGIEDEKYYWRTLVREINNPVNEADDSVIAFFHVNVSVSWDDSVNQSRLLELNTVVTGYKEE